MVNLSENFDVRVHSILVFSFESDHDMGINYYVLGFEERDAKNIIIIIIISLKILYKLNLLITSTLRDPPWLSRLDWWDSRNICRLYDPEVAHNYMHQDGPLWIGLRYYICLYLSTRRRTVKVCTSGAWSLTVDHLGIKRFFWTEFG